ncbi:MAG: hypothetical protein ACYC46_15960 [Acidobacteriaceae bacterium]
MIPGQLNLQVQAGNTFQSVLTWSTTPVGSTTSTPVDLTGCTANMQVRQNYGDPVLLALSSSVLTTNGSGITLGGTAGTITITITPLDAAALVSGIYDLEIQFSDGSIQTPVAGSVIVSPEVTVWP